jgi:hypothetical protein
MAVTTIGNGLRRIIAAAEPWYNWGEVYVERMQEIRVDDGGRLHVGGEGPVRYIELQWFGIHVAIQFGRTPKREGR